METRLGFVFTVALAALPVASFHSARAAEQTSIPLTEHIVTKKFDEHGVLASTVTSLEAVRADGSDVQIAEQIGGEAGHGRVVTDLPRGKRTAIDGFTRSITTYPLTPAEVRHLKAGRPCVAKQDAEWKMVFGFDVFRSVATVTMGGPDTDRHEEWVSPSLKCRPLAENTYFSNGAHNEMQVVSLTVGDPDDRLFEVPAGYVERSPSEVFQEAARLRGGECADCVGRYRSLDRAYASRHR